MKIPVSYLSVFLSFLILIIYLFLSALGLHCFAWAFSSCGEQGLLSGCGAQCSHGGGFSCGAQVLGTWGSVVVVLALEHGLSQQLWCLWCPVALQHVESSWARDQTCVPHTGRWTPSTAPPEKFSFLFDNDHPNQMWGNVSLCVYLCVCFYSSLPAAAAKSLQSCPTVRPHRRQPTRLLCPWDSPGKNTGVGGHFLLQCMHAC